MKLLILFSLAILVCGCKPLPGFNDDRYHNLIVQDAKGNFYVLISDKNSISSYYCNPVTNISFSVISKVTASTNFNKSN